MALGPQIIYFVGLDFVNYTDQVSGICEVAVMENKAQIFFVRVLI